METIWHMLRHDTQYRELGADYFLTQNLEGRKKTYCKKLQRLGFQVTLQHIPA